MLLWSLAPLLCCSFHQVPRSTVGMGHASKAFRRNRRVTGINVFQQKQMKGLGLRIGSDQYKAKQNEICEQWRLMNQLERARYEQMAAEQTMARRNAALKTLADSEAKPAVDRDELELPPSLCPG